MRLPLKIYRCVSVLVFSVGISGCKIDRTSIQMDSDNRLPSIGLDLRPKPKFERPGPIRQISGTASEPSGVELPTDRQPSHSRWSNWLNRFSKPKRIPLPRTDLETEREPTADAGRIRTPGSAF